MRGPLYPLVLSRVSSLLGTSDSVFLVTLVSVSPENRLPIRLHLRSNILHLGPYPNSTHPPRLIPPPFSFPWVWSSLFCRFSNYLPKEQVLPPVHS